jgi:hypothetical protein
MARDSRGLVSRQLGGEYGPTLPRTILVRCVDNRKRACTISATHLMRYGTIVPDHSRLQSFCAPYTKMASLTQDILQFMGKDPVGLTESDRVALLQASYKLTDTLENAGEKILKLWVTSIYELHVRHTLTSYIYL